jgi:hypothetical protein
MVNTNFTNHIPEEILDEFAMQMLCDEDQALWEEHLLVCDACQDRLGEVDEYIRIAKDTSAAISNPELQKRRSLAKPMMAATHAALVLAFVLGWQFIFLPR